MVLNKEGYHITNYDNEDWRFPIQDEFEVNMNEWQILGFYEDDKEISASKEVLKSFVFNKRYMVIAGNDVEENDNKENIENEVEYKILCTEPTGDSDFTNDSILMGYELPKTLDYPYITAMTKVKSNYYLVVTDTKSNKCFLYKLTDKGKTEQIAKDLQNFRLKKMRNFSKVKDKSNW